MRSIRLILGSRANANSPWTYTSSDTFSTLEEAVTFACCHLPPDIHDEDGNALNGYGYFDDASSSWLRLKEPALSPS